MRKVYSIPSALNLAAAGLSGSFAGGLTLTMAGHEEIDVEIESTFDAATVLTGQVWQVQVSDDNSHWEAVEAVLASTGAAGPTATLAASAGNTVRDRLQTNATRDAAYVRLAVKTTGGAAAGADAALANVKFSKLIS